MDSDQVYAPGSRSESGDMSTPIKQVRKPVDTTPIAPYPDMLPSYSPIVIIPTQLVPEVASSPGCQAEDSSPRHHSAEHTATEFTDNDSEDELHNELSLTKRRSARDNVPKVTAVSARSPHEAAIITAETRKLLAASGGSLIRSPGLRAVSGRYGAHSAVNKAHVVISGTASSLSQVGMLQPQQSEAQSVCEDGEAEHVPFEAVPEDIIGFSFTAGSNTMANSTIVEDLATTLGPPPRFHLYAGGRIPPEVLHIVMDHRRMGEEQDNGRRLREQKLHAGAFRSVVWMAGRVEEALAACASLAECNTPYPAQSTTSSGETINTNVGYPFPSNTFQNYLLAHPTYNLSAPLILQPQVYPYITSQGDYIQPPDKGPAPVLPTLQPLDPIPKSSDTDTHESGIVISRGPCRYLPATAKGLQHKRFVAASASWSQALMLTATGDVYQWRISPSDPLPDPEGELGRPSPLKSLSREPNAAQLNVDGASLNPQVPSSQELRGKDEMENRRTPNNADSSAIGLGPVLVQSLCWERAFHNIRITAVACGPQHCVALSSAPHFDVYTWGYGADGRLGHGTDRDESNPRLVTALMPFRVTAIAAGGAHTAVITMGSIDVHASEMYISQVHELYAESQDGEAEGVASARSTEGKLTESTAVVSNISAVTGASLKHHEEAKSGDDSLGAVWTFGRGTHGRLGHGTVEDCYVPRRVRHILRLKHRTIEPRPKECGLHAASSLSPRTPGNAVSPPEKPAAKARVRTGYFGRRTPAIPPVNPLLTAVQDLEWLRTAVPPSARTQKPLRERAVCTQVVCGRSFTAVVTADGDVWSWGKATDGQTGISKRRLQDLSAVAAKITGMKQRLPHGAIHDVVLNGDVVVPCRVTFSAPLHLLTKANLSISARTVHESSDPTTAILTCPYPLEGSARAQLLRSYPGLFSSGSDRNMKTDGSSVDLFAINEHAKKSVLHETASHLDDTFSVGTDGEFRPSLRRRMKDCLDPIQWATGFLPESSAVDPAEERMELPEDAVRIARLAAGHSHLVCAARDGSVWSWGMNNFGQVGIGSVGEVSIIPEPVQIPVHMFLEARAEDRVTADRAKIVSAVAMAERRRAQLDGDGSEATQFIGKENPITLHGIPFNRDPVVAVYAGPFHSVVATAGGAILAWGRNAEGALGQYTEKAKADPDIVQIHLKVTVAPKDTRDVPRPAEPAEKSAAEMYRERGATDVATVALPTQPEEGAGAQPALQQDHVACVLVGRPWRRILDVACGKDFTIFIETPVQKSEQRTVTVDAAQVPKVPRKSKQLVTGISTPLKAPGMEAGALDGGIAARGMTERRGSALVGGTQSGTEVGESQTTESPPLRGSRASLWGSRDKDSVADNASTAGQSVTAPLLHNLHTYGRIPKLVFDTEVRKIANEMREEMQRRKQEETRALASCVEWQRVFDTFIGDFEYALVVDSGLQKMWRQGIPSHMRGRAWLMALGNVARITPAVFELARQRATFIKRHAIRTRMPPRPMETGAPIPPTPKSPALGSFGSSRGTLPNPKYILHGKERTIYEIVTDLDRTFPTLHLFGPEQTLSEGPLGQIMRDVLEAFVIFRPDLGYVQGMSYMAAMLTLFICGQTVGGTLRRPHPEADEMAIIDLPLQPAGSAVSQANIRYSYSLLNSANPYPKNSNAANNITTYGPGGAPLLMQALEGPHSAPAVDTVFNRAVTALASSLSIFNISGALFKHDNSKDVIDEFPETDAPKPTAVVEAKARPSMRGDTPSLFSSLISTITGGGGQQAMPAPALPPPPKKRLHRTVTAPSRHGPALLVGDDKYLVFQALCNLMSKHHLYIFYSMDPSAAAPYYHLFDRFLQDHNPPLAAHLSECCIMGELYLLPWFQTIFLKALPIHSAAYVWDLFMLEGIPALFKTAAAILDLLTPHIMNDSPSFEETMQIFSQNIATKKTVWEQISGLHLLQPAIDAIHLPHLISLELNDLVNDPFFYRYVGGGRDALPYHEASLAPRFPLPHDNMAPPDRSRSNSWASLPSAAGKSISVVAIDESELRERRDTTPTASGVINELEKVF